MTLEYHDKTPYILLLFKFTFLPLIRNPIIYTDILESFHNDHHIARDNKAHSLIAIYVLTDNV